jgi:ribosomal-protein-alanine N-acetyltransferase
MNIETSRLFLRPIEIKDLQQILEYGQDEETGQYMIYWPKNENEIIEFIIENVNEMKKNEPSKYEYVMELKNKNIVIGNISLVITKGEMEIGWISNKKYWNNGYMTEAVNALIIDFIPNLKIEKIYATCTEKNVGTYRVMEKVGMKLVNREEDVEAMKKNKKVKYTKLRYEYSS